MLHQNQPKETTGLLHQERKQGNLGLKGALGTTSSSLSLFFSFMTVSLARFFLLSADKESSCCKNHIWVKQTLLSTSQLCSLHHNSVLYITHQAYLNSQARNNE